MDLGFLLDVSLKNLRHDQFQNILNSVKSIYASFKIGEDKTRVGVVTYSTRPRIACPFHFCQSTFRSCLIGPRYS